MLHLQITPKTKYQNDGKPSLRAVQRIQVYSDVVMLQSRGDCSMSWNQQKNAFWKMALFTPLSDATGFLFSYQSKRMTIMGHWRCKLRFSTAYFLDLVHIHIDCILTLENEVKYRAEGIENWMILNDEYLMHWASSPLVGNSITIWLRSVRTKDE